MIHFSFLSLYFINIKIKLMAYSSQGNHGGQLDFCNWPAVRRNAISITLRQVYQRRLS